MTDGDPAPAESAPADQPLGDPDELLFRQVHPTWIVDGVPSSQTFKPTPKDEGKLSIALASKIDAEGAYRHHIEVLKLASVGSWAVTVAEVTEAELNSFEEPLDDSPAHGFVDYRGLARRPTEKAAKVLLARMRARLSAPAADNDRLTATRSAAWGVHFRHVRSGCG